MTTNTNNTRTNNITIAQALNGDNPNEDHGFTDAEMIKEMERQEQAELRECCYRMRTSRNNTLDDIPF